jgi:predicted NAD/FAD-binding protein
MAAFLQRGGYSQQFVERYLYPMASAVWSMAPEEMDGFPALTLVQFFHNHGMLGVHTHPSWLTIRGGSHSYLEPITRPYKASIHRGVEIGAVRRLVDSVEISILGRPPRKFDEVVFACHGDQVLPLLADATDTERDVFSQFQTSRNEACLHTDGAMLPRRPAARASWNYLIGDKRKVTLTYDMNRLQRLPTEETYCVSLNANGRIAQEKAVARMVYHHPLYTSAAVAAQERWSEVSGVRRTHFCGAYWFYGFHEDGVRSALRVASSLGVTVQ